MLLNRIGLIATANGRRPQKFKFISLGIFLIILLSLTLLMGCISENSDPAEEITSEVSGTITDPGEDYHRSNEGNGVWVDITWINPPGSSSSEDEQDENLIFSIAKTTHAGDLLNYDLENNSVLVIDGDPVDLVISWELARKDPHHPVGSLIFYLSEEEMPVESITLVLRDLADVEERKFHWELAG